MPGCLATVPGRLGVARRRGYGNVSEAVAYFTVHSVKLSPLLGYSLGKESGIAVRKLPSGGVDGRYDLGPPGAVLRLALEEDPLNDLVIELSTLPRLPPAAVRFR